MGLGIRNPKEEECYGEECIGILQWVDETEVRAGAFEHEIKSNGTIPSLYVCAQVGDGVLTFGDWFRFNVNSGDGCGRLRTQDNGDILWDDRDCQVAFEYLCQMNCQGT